MFAADPRPHRRAGRRRRRRRAARRPHRRAARPRAVPRPPRALRRAGRGGEDPRRRRGPPARLAGGRHHRVRVRPPRRRSLRRLVEGSGDDGVLRGVRRRRDALPGAHEGGQAAGDAGRARAPRWSGSPALLGGDLPEPPPPPRPHPPRPPGGAPRGAGRLLRVPHVRARRPSDRRRRPRAHRRRDRPRRRAASRHRRRAADVPHRPAVRGPPGRGRAGAGRALPAGERAGDGQGRRGHRLLPVQPARLAQRGGRRPVPLRDRAGDVPRCPRRRRDPASRRHAHALDARHEAGRRRPCPPPPVVGDPRGVGRGGDLLARADARRTGRRSDRTPRRSG